MIIPYSWVIIAVLSSVVVLCLYLIVKLLFTTRRLRSLVRSKDVKRGFWVEQLLPLAKSYPWSHENFKFLGNPIDGVHFEEDEVVFVEFKSGKSQLSARQKKLREIIKAGRVSFKEVRAKIKNNEFDGIEIK